MTDRSSTIGGGCRCDRIRSGRVSRARRAPGRRGAGGGDATFQQRCLERMRYVINGATTFVFVYSRPAGDEGHLHRTRCGLTRARSGRSDERATSSARYGGSVEEIAVQGADRGPLRVRDPEVGTTTGGGVQTGYPLEPPECRVESDDECLAFLSTWESAKAPRLRSPSIPAVRSPRTRRECILHGAQPPSAARPLLPLGSCLPELPRRPGAAGLAADHRFDVFGPELERGPEGDRAPLARLRRFAMADQRRRWTGSASSVHAGTEARVPPTIRPMTERRQRRATTISKLEHELAERVGRSYCIATGSGTMALTMALEVLGLPPGPRGDRSSGAVLRASFAVALRRRSPASATSRRTTTCSTLPTWMPRPPTGHARSSGSPFGSPAPVDDLAAYATISLAAFDRRPAAQALAAYCGEMLGGFGRCRSPASDTQRSSRLKEAEQLHRRRRHGACASRQSTALR